MGVAICYDIRFPELSMMMREQGCKMIIFPGAFNMTTGPAHWTLLQRARAVDQQVYVAAVSPVRDFLTACRVCGGEGGPADNKRRTWLPCVQVAVSTHGYLSGLYLSAHPAPLTSFRHCVSCIVMLLRGTPIQPCALRCVSRPCDGYVQ